MTFPGTPEEWQRAAKESDAAMADATSRNLSEYDSAVAIDPGTTTGVAITTGPYEPETQTLDFWELQDYVPAWGKTESLICIVEAPYLSRFGKTYANSARAYDSGRVAREAELLVEGLKLNGCEVIEHDPHSSGTSKWGGGKWDSDTAHQIVGEWNGPDNEHTRDALRLLVTYGFAA